jgi:uncharacterized protein
MEYQRTIQTEIERQMLKGKIIIIYGARRVGKTTLVKQILQNYPDNSEYLNCEIFTNKSLLETTNHKEIEKFLGNKKLIVLDEAQHIDNIGTTLKIIADTYPKHQIIATGSSSFDLANETSEPLTGRARRFLLYPLSLQEIRHGSDLLEIEANLNNFLRFGLYPSVVNQSEMEAKEELDEIARNYLYKDILNFQKIKNSNLLLKLLQALAFQIGNEVSAHEISNLVGENYHTIERYIDLLEKCFVIFRLRSLSRNPRKEIGKKYKVYFYDLGIRNSLIQNYNKLDLRNDLGALWENFCILERIKFNNNNRKFLNTYFWKAYSGKEIDYIEEYDGRLFAYEMKWGSEKKHKCPKGFADYYKDYDFSVVNRKNYLDFLVT